MQITMISLMTSNQVRALFLLIPKMVSPGVLCVCMPSMGHLFDKLSSTDSSTGLAVFLSKSVPELTRPDCEWLTGSWQYSHNGFLSSSISLNLIVHFYAHPHLCILLFSPLLKEKSKCFFFFYSRVALGTPLLWEPCWLWVQKMWLLWGQIVIFHLSS